MAIPVYVQSVTTYPGRTEWSNTADYVVGDRVYYADSISDYSVYVCIQDQDLSGGGTAQQPDLTPNYWRAAGSKEYPFLTGSGGNIYNSNFTGTEFCVRRENSFENDWDPARYLSISDGSERAHVILMDGIFIPLGGGQAYMDLSNTDFFAENFQKSLFVFTYYDDSNASTTENCPTFNNLKIGLHNANVSFDSHIILNNCLVSDSSPYSTRTSLKVTHRFQYSKFIQAKNCLFDFSMCRNNLLAHSSSISSTFGPSFLKNSTFIYGGQENQYGGIFYNSNNLTVDKCIFYIKGVVDLPIPKVVSISVDSITNSCVFGESFVDVDYFVGGDSSMDDSNLLNVDPQFIDLENRDYRLRASSPLIGGINNSTKQLEMESEYPQGKWFDSNAAAGGDGSWETPYNNYGEAINSFTGDEAVVLIKEGQHPLLQGFWNGSSWDISNDLPKAYLGGVKLIGMGKKSIFTAGNEVSSFPAFFNSSYNGTTNPNLIDTPFLLKDFTILLTSSSPYNRSLWSLRKGVMINIHVRPEGPGLGNSESNLFDYNMYSDTGDYLHMTSCTIEVTFQGIYGDFCYSEGQKQFSSCTFIDPNHTRSRPDYAKNFMHNSAGNVSGSFIKDCIFYTKSSGFNNTGASTTLCQLLNTVFYSTQDELTLSPGINKTNCAVVDPGFINDNGYEQMDLRLRSDSPLIGGLSKYPSVSTSIWYVDLIDGDDTNDGKTPDTAMLTIPAAHAASIHLDTIIIVNKHFSTTAVLEFPAGRKYQSLTKCTIDFNDTNNSFISSAAGLDTHIKGFDFIKMRGGSSLLNLSDTDANSLFVIENCKFEGILTSSQSAPIGGNGTASRSARQGSMIKGCSFDIGWSTQMTRGSESSGFIAVDRTDIISCTFWVKDSTPLGSTVLYLVGTGGQGAHSHGPPIGPIEVKNCIVHGNDRMHYGMGGAGDGGNLGFTSNTRVTINSANYVIHNCCLYGINGTPMEIDNSISNNRYNNGSIASDRNIPREWIENIILEDPQFVDSSSGSLQLKPQSPLIGQGI